MKIAAVARSTRSVLLLVTLAAGALAAGCSGGGETTGSPSTVFGRQARELAVGIQALRRENRVEIDATVLAQDGSERSGLEVELGAGTGGAWAPAEPCGSGRYCGEVRATGPKPTIRLRIKRLDGTVWTVSAVLPRDPRPEGAAQIVRDSLRAVRELNSLVIHEHLDSGPPYKALVTVFTYVAPNRMSYWIAGGGAAVVVGPRRWDRGGVSQDWLQSRQDPIRVPTPDWRQALHPSILGSGIRNGRKVWRVSFYDSTIPAWFEVDVDVRTKLPLWLSMTGASHFMIHDYRAFNAPLDVQPPQS
jgi:hypothetical protein